MRLEQLVLFGPSDNFTVTFGPRVTVLSGLDPAERSGLLQTLVEAMAGQVPNASVVFVDSAGRRVFADRMGATYAETGVAAPTLGDLLGTDPSLIADLVTLTADDLGIGASRSPDEVAAELAGARAAHAQVLAEQAAANQVIIDIEQLDLVNAVIPVGDLWAARLRALRAALAPWAETGATGGGDAGEPSC